MCGQGIFGPAPRKSEVASGGLQWFHIHTAVLKTKQGVRLEADPLLMVPRDRIELPTRGFSDFVPGFSQVPDMIYLSYYT